MNVRGQIAQPLDCIGPVTTKTEAVAELVSAPTMGMGSAVSAIANDEDLLSKRVTLLASVNSTQGSRNDVILALCAKPELHNCSSRKDIRRKL